MKKKKILCMLLMLAFALLLGASAGAATYTWKSVGNGNKQCYKNGVLVKNAWVGNRHLNSNGYMDRNTWVKKKVDGVTTTVFVGNDGNWIKNFHQGWWKIGGKYYYYTSKGVMLKSRWITLLTGKYYVNKNGVRVTGLQKIGSYRYYFKSNGVMKTGWKTVNGKTYFFRYGSGRAITGCFYKFSSGSVAGRTYYFGSDSSVQLGWQQKDGSWYYFANHMQTGWLTLDGKKYYLSTSTGARCTGIVSIDSKLYYFDENGVMQTGTTVTYQGRKYIIASDGVCTLVPDSTDTVSEKMLFFLTFESGSEAYDQTGGDSGCACGAYQFDYRYSLLLFIKYAYGKNPTLCAEFKTYAAMTNTEANRKKLKSNEELYTAWHTIYKRNPTAFAALQDKFAKENYYDPVEQSLARQGIDLATRSDVVKGAVYSYSIQRGSGTAVAAVIASKAADQKTDKGFLKKLYQYRIKQYPAYESRYQAEYEKAVSLL